MPRKNHFGRRDNCHDGVDEKTGTDARNIIFKKPKKEERFGVVQIFFCGFNAIYRKIRQT
jgi:hypothetical protein